MSAGITGADLLAYRVPPMEVPLAALGRSVYVRRFGSRERDLIGQASLRVRGDNTDGFVGFRALTVFLSACDAEGKRLYQTDEERQALEDLDGEVVEEIATAALRFNGMLAGAVEEQKKTSESTPTNSSGSS